MELILLPSLIPAGNSIGRKKGEGNNEQVTIKKEKFYHRGKQNIFLNPYKNTQYYYCSANYKR